MSTLTGPGTTVFVHSGPWEASCTALVPSGPGAPAPAGTAGLQPACRAGLSPFCAWSEPGTAAIAPCAPTARPGSNGHLHHRDPFALRVTLSGDSVPSWSAVPCSVMALPAWPCPTAGCPPLTTWELGPVSECLRKSLRFGLPRTKGQSVSRIKRGALAPPRGPQRTIGALCDPNTWAPPGLGPSQGSQGPGEDRRPPETGDM